MGLSFHILCLTPISLHDFQYSHKINLMYFSLPFAFMFGASIGSFLNVVIRRLPGGMSLVHPPSHCFNCNSPIAWYDNIPIISWIVLRGSCRICGSKISFGYAAVELLVALIFVWIERRYGFGAEFIINAIFITSLFAVTLIDYEHMIIPNIITIPGTLLGFSASFLPGGIEPLNSFIGLVSGAGVLAALILSYKFITGREGMGWGDVKLLMMIGAFLGYEAMHFVLISAAMIGLVVGGGYVVFSKKGRYHPVPFGPFLSIGAAMYTLEEFRIHLWMNKIMDMFIMRVAG